MARRITLLFSVVLLVQCADDPPSESDADADTSSEDSDVDREYWENNKE